jgi:hypothetical protein
VRNSRARALGAGRRAGLAATLAALAPLALCACTGPDLISLGGALPDTMERFLSPAGNDANAGTTSDSPWKTFRFALPKLEPGQTLHLLNGTYEDATTGTLNVRCADASPGSTVPDAVLAKNGLAAPGKAITVRADSEHLAFIRGSGSVPPVSIDSCQSWSIEGMRVESQDVDGALPQPDAGSVVVLDGANDHVTLDRLLALHPNHHQHAQVIRVGDGASDVTVSDCELYDFHESGIEARRSQNLVIDRNYVNAQASDPTKGSLGSIGVRLEETRVVHVVNNVVEDVGIGFAVVGRGADVPPSALAQKIELNLLRGNIVFEPANIGFRIDSQCAGANPCDASHTVSATELSNDVVYRGALGVDDAGSVGTTMSRLSIIEALRGVVVGREPLNKFIPAATMITSTLVSGFQSVGFFMDPMAGTWSISHCDSNGGYLPTGPYQPDDGRVTDKVTIMPDLGSCIAYIPAQSKLRTGAPNDVGANVIYEYDETGQQTTNLLWMPSFAGCGNVVRDVNDSMRSCTNVNERLVADDPTLCPLPPR